MPSVMQDNNMKARYQYRFYPTDQQQQSTAAVVWLCASSLERCSSAVQAIRKKAQIRRASENSNYSGKADNRKSLVGGSVKHSTTAVCSRWERQHLRTFSTPVRARERDARLVILSSKKRTSSQSARLTRVGLAFCKMVVEAHGGEICVRNNQPQGAIFEITLAA